MDKCDRIYIWHQVMQARLRVEKKEAKKCLEYLKQRGY